MGAIAKFEQKEKVLQDFFLFFKSTCLELQCIFIAVETTNMNLAYKCAWFLNGLYKYSKTIKKIAHLYKMSTSNFSKICKGPTTDL